MRAMKADRLGSYSSRSTVAATLNLRRLKSIRRRRCLWPPPMWWLVMWPWLLRPPDFFLPTVSDFTGSPSHRTVRSTMNSRRNDGVIGLKLFRAMTLFPASQARGHVDLLTFSQRDDRLLPVAPHAGTAAEKLLLALHGDGVDRL